MCIQTRWLEEEKERKKEQEEAEAGKMTAKRRGGGRGRRTRGRRARARTRKVKKAHLRLVVDVVRQSLDDDRGLHVGTQHLLDLLGLDPQPGHRAGLPRPEVIRAVSHNPR